MPYRHLKIATMQIHRKPRGPETLSPFLRRGKSRGQSLQRGLECELPTDPCRNLRSPRAPLHLTGPYQGRYLLGAFLFHLLVKEERSLSLRDEKGVRQCLEVRKNATQESSLEPRLLHTVTNQAE